MATAKGVNKTLEDAGQKRAPGSQNGHVKVLMDSYVFPADVFSASDFISIGSLPKGAKVIGAGIAIPVSLGTTGQFTLGTADDPDGFVGTTDAGGQAAIKKASTEALIGAAALAAETEVLLDCSEATDAAEDDLIYAWVEYVMD